MTGAQSRRGLQRPSRVPAFKGPGLLDPARPRECEDRKLRSRGKTPKKRSRPECVPGSNSQDMPAEVHTVHGLFLRSARENHAQVAMQMMAPFTPRSMTYGQVLLTQASLGSESRPLCTLHARTRICTQRRQPAGRFLGPSLAMQHATRTSAQTCELATCLQPTRTHPHTCAAARARPTCRCAAPPQQRRGYCARGGLAPDAPSGPASTKDR